MQKQTGSFRGSALSCVGILQDRALLHRLLPVLLLTASWACKDDVQIGDPKTESPTWHQDIAPIVTLNCVSCHDDGGIAAYRPWKMPYDDYIKPWAGLIAQQVESRVMPPFYAGETDECTPRFGWLHDPRLDQRDIDLIVEWAEAGAPLGKANTAADLEVPIPQGLEEWDLELIPAVGYKATPGDDVQICFPLPAEVAETKWLEAVQIIPGVTESVHHVQLRIDYDGVERTVNEDGWYECTGALDGEDIGGYLPGTPPVQFPTDVAMAVEPGSVLVMQIHYHPDENIPAADIDFDRTALRLKFTDEPLFQPRMMRIGNDSGPKPWGGLESGPNDPPGGPAFFIPANVDNHTERMSLRIDMPGEHAAFVVANHMHFVGKSARLWVEHASPQGDEPAEECLLNTPVWDFSWQQFYNLDFDSDQVPHFRQGDTVWLECTFDNTTNNEDLVDQLHIAGLAAPIDVSLGSGATDEMCAAMVGVVTLSP